MSVLYFFVGVAIVGVVIASTAFFIAMRSGQFDDLEGPAYRILYDDDDPMIPANRRRLEQQAQSGESSAAEEHVDSGSKES